MQHAWCWLPCSGHVLDSPSSGENPSIIFQFECYSNCWLYIYTNYQHFSWESNLQASNVKVGSGSSHLCNINISLLRKKYEIRMNNWSSARPFQTYSFIHSKEETKIARGCLISSRSKFRTSKLIHLESPEGPAVSKKIGIFPLLQTTHADNFPLTKLSKKRKHIYFFSFFPSLSVCLSDKLHQRTAKPCCGRICWPSDLHSCTSFHARELLLLWLWYCS